jgi:glycosyltransferase involved in cell wall biosynthesis
MVFSILVSRVDRTSDAVVTVSQAAAQDLRRYYKLSPTRIHVVPNGVSYPESVPAEKVQMALSRHAVSAPYFLYVGALHPRKNIRRVIEAFKLVKERHSGLSLVIVGPPSWGAQDELQAVLGSTGDNTGIIFTGFLSDEDLGALYQGAYGLVFPSLYEGFGLPVLEAMSYGTPVITSNVSSLPEVAGDAALLVDPMAVADIAEKMTMLLEDTALHAGLREKGYARCKKFSWGETARGTYDVYRSLLPQPAPMGE